MNLTCCCCGSGAPAKEQWFNRDRGFGLCGGCAAFLQPRMDPTEFRDCYGEEGVHWMPLSPQETSHPWACGTCGGRFVVATVAEHPGHGRRWYCPTCRDWREVPRG